MGSSTHNDKLITYGPFPLTTTIYWQWSTYSYIVHTEITPGFLATSEASLCLPATVFCTHR